MRCLVVAALVVVAWVGLIGCNPSPILSTSLPLTGAVDENGVKIDLEHLIKQASQHHDEHDIEEDENDRFITKRNGDLRNLSFDKRRPSEWAEEPSTAPQGILSRVKRCGGGGGGDDDDGDADRARRIRRTRKRVSSEGKKKKKIKKKRAKKTTTVKVIQNGQVVSETKTVHDHVPVVKQTTTTTTTQYVHPQPQVVSTVHHQQLPHVQQVVHHQPAAVVQHQPAPLVQVQQQPATVQVQPPSVQVQPAASVPATVQQPAVVAA